MYDTRDGDRTTGLLGDCDDDKYRRRPALGWLAQLLRYWALGRESSESLRHWAQRCVTMGVFGVDTWARGWGLCSSLWPRPLPRLAVDLWLHPVD